VELVAALAYSADRLERSLARMEVREDAMRGHLARASAEITAEPLYIVLALAGHADAYETVRRIARDARARGEPVLAAARRDAEIARILDRAGPDQRRVLEDPSAYIGVAVRRTEEVCAYWEGAIARMIASCPAALKAAGRSR
jgi:adenylosuccinate lyase